MCRGSENCWHQRRERKRVCVMWDFLFLFLSLSKLCFSSIFRFHSLFFLFLRFVSFHDLQRTTRVAWLCLLLPFLLHFTALLRSLHSMNGPLPFGACHFLFLFLLTATNSKFFFLFNLVDLVALNLQLAGIVVDNCLRL